MTYSWLLFWKWKQHTGARAMRSCVQRGAPVRKPVWGILQKHRHNCSSDSPRPALQAKYGSADCHNQRESTLTPYFLLYWHSYISNPAFVDLCKTFPCANSGTPRNTSKRKLISYLIIFIFCEIIPNKRQRSANTVCCAVSANKSSHTAGCIRHLLND